MLGSDVECRVNTAGSLLQWSQVQHNNAFNNLLKNINGFSKICDCYTDSPSLFHSPIFLFSSSSLQLSFSFSHSQYLLCHFFHEEWIGETGMRVISLSKPCMLCFHGFLMHSFTPNSITPYFFIVRHKRLHMASLSHFHSVFISFQIP